MATSIQFTDEDGAVTLTNGKPVPGDRLAGWVPLINVVGDFPVGYGNGITYGWVARTDYGARFALEYIPQASLESVIRLIRWLTRGQSNDVGGTATLNTGDKFGNVYTVRIWPGFRPEPPELMDRETLEHRMVLEVLNTEQQPMLYALDVEVSS